MTKAVDKFHEFDRFGSILGLERVRELLKRLGDPHEGMKYIHVAGTNGKGSTCKFLEKGLAGCGYKVGLYTSPYIEKFNERIQFDGRQITDEELELYGDQALAKAAEMVADGLDSPTEFEVVMATAFLYFKSMNPDIVILEVGMGGIGDATNVIEHPLASVITSIGFDHMHVLGDTLAEIAVNKAGIIKKGCPVISNVKDHDAAAVIARKAYETGSRLYDVSKIKCSTDWISPEGQQVSCALWYTDYSEVVISMIGRHQAENLKTALATIEVLRQNRDITIERSRLYAGLKEAVQPGRFEVIFGPAKGENDPEETAAGDWCGAYVVLDGAHNDAGAEAIRQAMGDVFPGKRTLIVAGMVEKKETDKVLAHLAGVSRDFIATQPDYEGRAMDAEVFAEHIRKTRDEAGQPLNILDVCNAPAQAVESARKQAETGRYDVVLFTGSLYLIGEVRSILHGSTDYDYYRTLKYGDSREGGDK